jgi:tetratricopeptide (TPR) repeat protein
MTRTTAILSIALACASGHVVFGQALNDVRKLYESGQYQQVVASASADPDPRVAYLRGQSQQKLGQPNDARQTYTQLAARPDSDPWHFIGQSALALVDRDSAGALNASNQAVARNGSLSEAHFQRGLALTALQDMTGASAAFQKASDLDPYAAYPHFYAGLAYSKIKRADLTAQHFQTFLRLAPQAPERAEVQSILKTLSR